MRFLPHDYQKYAIEFVEKHTEACLLLEMGLGKTIITLTAVESLLFDSFEVHKVLVIAPLRVAQQSWPAEIKKWEHLGILEFSVVTGTAKERMEALSRQADIYIINRENVPWLIEKSGIGFDFDMVVVDELSSFKSHQSKRFKALMKVRPLVKRVVGLTGTPSSNGLMDLWAEYKIIDMGKRLGRFIGSYRRDFFVPDRMNGFVVYSYALIPGAEEEIYRRIQDITISMTADDNLKMPELILGNVEVEMNRKEAKAYKEFAKMLVLEMGEREITAANAAVLSGKLCQLANGAVYDDNGSTAVFHDRKLDALEDLIEAANGKPLLVAYWFKHDLERIRQRFDVREIRTVKDIEDWNAGKIPVAVIHPASAGHGLNLQSGGDHLVWFGLTWSLELYQQTNARLYRQGQESGTVVIQHIVCCGTVDERILKALKEKDSTQSALVEAVKAVVDDEAV